MKLEHLTDTHDDGVVVFLLGMQVRRPWRLDQWGYVAFAMTRMMAELERSQGSDTPEDDLGYLGGFGTMGRGGPVYTLYWRSVEDLTRYANDADRVHRPAWLRVYRMVHRARSAAIGLWHETYDVPAGRHETIYGNMEPVGLGKIVGAVDVRERGVTAAERLRAS